MTSSKRPLPKGSNGRPAKKVKKDPCGVETEDFVILKTKVKAGSAADMVLLKDIARLRLELSESVTDLQPQKFTELEVDITMINSSGDGMGLFGDYSCIVPFTLPGDKVIAQPYFINLEEKLALCDLVKVTSDSPSRQNDLIRCKYFGKCSGCQLQMLSYEEQLIHKRRVVEHAFRDFSGLDPTLIPSVLDTVGSPLTYSYRTKITPHFDQPRHGPRAKPNIGFNEKGRRRVLDIEECPIATKELNSGLTIERQNVFDNLETYKRGSTILLRQNSEIVDGVITGSYTSDSKAVITEFIGDYTFKSPAGSFFQNNNSIMPLLTQYVSENLGAGDERHLVDAYCGSGLFSITCGKNFTSVIGIEIASEAIHHARENAKLNGLTNTSFQIGSAEAIFKDLKVPHDETSIIIDPPRKGCDEVFLDQLLAFNPDRIVYVSCCVQTQARDIGYIISRDSSYIIDSIRGFDLFPQTYHVEGVAVLRKSR